MALKIHYNRLIGGDKSLWVIFFLLGMISLLVVWSSTTALVYARAEIDTWRELLAQFRFIVVGLLIVWVVHLIDIKQYNRYARLMFGLSLFAMLLVFVPGIGVKINGAYRWIQIPFTGITFQPSDFLKFSVMFILAQQLAIRQKSIDRIRILPSLRARDWRRGAPRQAQVDTLFDHTLPLLGPVALACGIILAFNFSTSALLFVTCLLILVIGRVRMVEIGRLLLVVILALVLAVAVMKATGIGRADTWLARLGIGQTEQTTSNRTADGDYDQVEQAKIAIASGGLLGKGPGNSTQRTHLPLPYSDFAYAFITEEYGLAGALTVMILYLWIFSRTVFVARRCETAFPNFLVLGLGLMIITQAMTNMAVAVDIAPTTGQPLPLISKGGTSIMFISLAIGVIIGVSRQMEEKEAAQTGLPNPSV
jgi:cell division protein FtsW